MFTFWKYDFTRRVFAKINYRCNSKQRLCFICKHEYGLLTKVVSFHL